MPCTVTGTTIVLSGDVGDVGFYYDDGPRGFGSSDIVSALAQVGDGKDITIRINSAGGIATEGSAIHAALSRHRGRKTVIVEGVAASAASVIAMAGDEVEMSLGALMMVHDPAAITFGTVADHEATIAGLMAIGDAMAAVYAAKSGQAVEVCRADMRAETWMTPEQAVAKGYADRVASSAVAVEPAPYPYTAYHHAPARLVALARANRWDRTRKPTALAAPTPRAEDAMPLNDDDKTFINTTIATAIAAALKDGQAKPAGGAGASEPAQEPAAVAALMRSEVAAIPKACAEGGMPGMTEALLAEGVTLAVARQRIGQAGGIKDMVALARKGTPTIPEDFAAKAIASGKTVEAVRAELFDQMVAQGRGSDDENVRSFHRAGNGGADRAGRSASIPTAAVRDRGKALMAAAVKRMGMTPKTGA